VSLVVVIVAQSAATSRAYAVKYQEDVDEDADLVGLGAANLAAGLSGSFVVNGSPTKTEIIDNQGSRSQISSLTAAAVVLVVLLTLTAPLHYLPIATLATVVFVVAVRLVDIRGMMDIYRLRPDEFVVALVTMVTVMGFGVEPGLILAVVFSMVNHLRRGYHPNNVLVEYTDDGLYRPCPVSTGAQMVPGLAVYRFNSSLYYANAELFGTEALSIISVEHPPQWLCVDFLAVTDVDYTAGKVIGELHHALHSRGIALVFSEVNDDVRARLDHYGITALTGSGQYFSSLNDVRLAFERRTATPS
jgi:SulP family sulfate permease